MRRTITRLLLASLAVLAPAAAEPPDGPATPGEPAKYEPLDLPDWRIVEAPARAESEPWLVVIDDPQCPYCMLLHLGIVKARQAGDPELTRAVVVRVPFPLYIHDQSAHIVMDAFCLESTRPGRPWSASSYLDWLLDADWETEPGWASTSLADLEREGGRFEARYERHRVTSSRRRDYQMRFVEAESACGAATERGLPSPSCRGDAACEALCDEQLTCRAACTSRSARADGSCGECALGNVTTEGFGTSEAPGEAEAPEQQVAVCLEGCTERFRFSRWAQFSKAHAACLLDGGPDSARAKTAASVDWAVAHQIPGTPTLYVGHPRIGFRKPADAESMSAWIAAIGQELAEVRRLLAVAP